MWEELFVETCVLLWGADSALGDSAWLWGALAGGGHPKGKSVNSQVLCVYFQPQALKVACPKLRILLSLQIPKG